ncbi:hypothetical protein [Nostoc sp.]|uniref:hypothetical protein n=1 Tax=Nostoc sp. TaxID=1180 RepID=UPI003FA54782
MSEAVNTPGAIAIINKRPMCPGIEGLEGSGSWLLERGLTPKYAHLGTHKEGCGGLWEQYPYQGIDPVSIIKKVKELLGGR